MSPIYTALAAGACYPRGAEGVRRAGGVVSSSPSSLSPSPGASPDSEPSPGEGGPGSAAPTWSPLADEPWSLSGVVSVGGLMPSGSGNGMAAPDWPPPEVDPPELPPTTGPPAPQLTVTTVSVPTNRPPSSRDPVRLAPVSPHRIPVSAVRKVNTRSGTPSPLTSSGPRDVFHGRSGRAEGGC